MNSLIIGIPGAAWGHHHQAIMAYARLMAKDLENQGHTVLPLPFRGHGLLECAKQLIDPMKGCDVILTYSMTSMLAELAVGLQPNLTHKRWIGLCPVPPTGLSYRAFAWAVRSAPLPFLRAFFPPLPGVKLDMRSLERVMGGRGVANIGRGVSDLHAEPLLHCLQASFPRAFGLTDKMGDIHWDSLVVPSRDGFVCINDLRGVSAHRTLTPEGEHGFPMTPEGRALVCDLVNEIAEQRRRA